MHIAIATEWQQDLSLEAAKWQLHAMNENPAEFLRQRAVTYDDQRLVFDRGLDGSWIDAGQPDKDNNVSARFEHIDRWLPQSLANPGLCDVKELAV